MPSRYRGPMPGSTHGAPTETVAGPKQPDRPRRTLRVAGKGYPLILPSIRDPRLHVAAVIITIHVLGQVGLGFDVSVPQILAAMGACAVIEVGWTFARTREIVWPASALLTGSGVALIFRIVGFDGGHWSVEGWHLFALVAAGSLLTKYLIRYRGGPLFNPSNVGLVAAFLILGSDLAEPLDFWWGRLDPWLALAYLVILVGGFLITRRLGLLPMATAFWLTFVAGLGVLALSGHCITARWAFDPVCDDRFFSVVATSPEVAVFLFFMITDPRTIPSGARERIWFGVLVAVVSLVFMAPQATEFGAKVGLLGGLVVLTALRPILDRVGWGQALARPAPALVPGLLIVVPTILVVAGGWAREPVGAGGDAPVEPIEVAVDTSTLPIPTIEPDVLEIDPSFGDLADDLAVELARRLATEAEALLRGDAELMASAALGSRLNEMEYRLSQWGSAETVIPTYHFESLHLFITQPDGPQGGADPAFEARGTVDELTIDPDGQEVGRSTRRFARAFSLRQTDDGRWLISGSHPLQP